MPSDTDTLERPDTDEDQPQPEENSQQQQQQRQQRQKKGGGKLAEKALSTAGPEGRLAAIALKSKKLQTLAKVGVAMNPTTIAFIVIAVLILIMIFMLVSNPPEETALKLTKTGPTEAQAGDILSYQIVVVFPGMAEDIQVRDPLPEGTEYVRSVPDGRYDSGTRTVTWSLVGPNPPPGARVSNINTTLTLELRATKTDSHIVNIARGTVINPVNSEEPPTDPADTTNVPPTQDNCTGKYKLTSPFGNFGDPNCNFSKNDLARELVRLDPLNAHRWDSIITCESRYNPNAYNPKSSSGKGAYGLLQMNPVNQGNGIYDAGNVVWPLQVSNAINYNKKLGGSFRYWQCRHSIGL